MVFRPTDVIEINDSPSPGTILISDSPQEVLHSVADNEIGAAAPNSPSSSLRPTSRPPATQQVWMGQWLSGPATTIDGVPASPTSDLSFTGLPFREKLFYLWRILDCQRANPLYQSPVLGGRFVELGADHDKSWLQGVTESSYIQLPIYGKLIHCCRYMMHLINESAEIGLQEPGGNHKSYASFVREYLQSRLYYPVI